MAKSTTTTKLERIKPNPSLQRRNSTGGAAAIFSRPNPIPNYLRASIGSCHDLCKYGATRDYPGLPGESGKNINMRPEVKPNISNRVKKVPETKNTVPASSRRKPNEVSKSTCNARAVLNDHEGKKRTPLPRPTSSAHEPSVRIPVSKIRRSNSVPRKVLKSEPRKLLESSKKTTEGETVAEKTIHIVEAEAEAEAEDRSRDEGVVSSRDDQKREMDSEGNNDSKREMEEVVERESNEVVVVDDWKERRLRRVVSEGDVDLNEKEKERLRLIVISKNKVKALVNTFETLMTT